MKTITNGTVTISVKSHGAELASIQCGGREYLWQADEAFWKRHSPVLFPIVGAVWNGTFRSHGAEYAMGQHGLARDMDFSLVYEDSETLRYRLTSSTETLQKYPYPFLLEIAYHIEGRRVRIIWHVENTGSEEMAFQIGAHPAFYWPFLSNEEIRGGVTKMEPALSSQDSRGFFRLDDTERKLTLSVITENGCVGECDTLTTDAEGFLPLNVSSFDRDALIFEDSQLSKVTLCRNDRTPYLSVEFSSPLVGLWSPPRKRAPFVCIEPWYGRTDSVGYDGSFEEKEWMQHLMPGAAFDAHYDIILEE